MVTGFIRSKEGEEQYQKINQPYEDSADDLAYKEFLRVTRTSPQKDRKRVILSLTKKVIGSKEYILWNERNSALDGLGNEKHHFFGRMGTYPIPVPIYQRRQIPETLEAEVYISGIKETKTGYSVPFTTKAADSFYKDCLSEDDGGDRTTEYSIEVGNSRISVDSFEDWRNGSTKELKRFGHQANKFEKQRMDDEESGKLSPPPGPPK
jgi:hypothetical protein